MESNLHPCKISWLFYKKNVSEFIENSLQIQLNFLRINHGKIVAPPRVHTCTRFLKCVSISWQIVPVQVSGLRGGMAERLKAHVLKTCLGHTNVGSNPTPSAGFTISDF